MTISIIDYGMGNIRSIINALKHLGAEPQVVKSPSSLNKEKIIVPGVGAFGDAMKNLRPYSTKIRSASEQGKQILGICIGMHILFEKSEESPGTKGLSLLKGSVEKIQTEYKLPHIGWNSLKIEKENFPLFKGVKGGYVYYANSYHATPEENIKTATSPYGTNITASVWDGGNIFGVQFHPEKSGKIGLRILKNFLEI